MTYIKLFVQIFIIGAFISVVFALANRRLVKFYESRPHLKFRRQLIQITGVLVGILFVILFMPFSDELRGQLLSLFGLIVSATIALSSTTLVGNIMAGIMLKIIGNCRPGNYVTVGDYFGRITEMDLLHVEIQTEERDLTTLPNFYFVTNPVRVMRSSGTMLAVELSLGYDVPRHDIETLLIDAATNCGLESPFVQIRNLGDFSVTYRVSGLLKDVNRLLDKRRELRARTMDALHSEDIEIVSPTFMNTRAFDTQDLFVSEVAVTIGEEGLDGLPDSIVFDKAARAESVEKLREKLAEAQERMKICDEQIAEPANAKAGKAAEAEKVELETRIERLQSIIDRKEAKISKD